MDIFYGKRKRMIMAGLMSGGCCILMVIFPQVAMDSARKGISLWASSVLPALLPFFICANFLQNIGVIRYLKSGTFPFLMSVLSGYPMGAKIVGDLRRSSEISVGEAKRLMSFCSTFSGRYHCGGSLSGSCCQRHGIYGSFRKGVQLCREHAYRRRERNAGIADRGYAVSVQITGDNPGLYCAVYFCYGYDASLRGVFAGRMHLAAGDRLRIF